MLCYLDGVPTYVGQSTDGIRARVARHLTSARSDVIVNRQLDVWEVAYVQAYPVENRAEITPLEPALIHHFEAKSSLINGRMPPKSIEHFAIPSPAQVVQVLSDAEINTRKDPVHRLPRQAEHYARMVDHFLTVTNPREIARAMQAHFQRLAKYHGSLLRTAVDEE